MNFRKIFDELEHEVMVLNQRAQDLERKTKRKIDQLEAAEYQTGAFLDRCKERGLSCVSIGMRTERIPVSVTYPFEPCDIVFGDGWDKLHKGNGSPDPAIWAAARDVGIAYGCGSSGSHQADCRHLIDGVYVCKDGVWRKVD